MTRYKDVPDNKLKRMADTEDPEALYEIAVRSLALNKQAAAKKYYILAAQLGHAGAAAELAAMYESKGDYKRAETYYRAALRAGNDAVTPYLAKVVMRSDENAALDILITGAMSGDKASMQQLESYYRSKGDETEAAYWGMRSKKA